MDQRFRRGFTAVEKTELWDRWQRGELLKAIGRAFGKPSSSIYYQMAPHCGICPASRHRSRLALTLSEREEISRGLAAHQSAQSMARLLGRSVSTVSRELKRNGGYDGYRAAPADERAWVRTRRPKRCKLAANPRLRRTVARKLRLNWRPSRSPGGWRERILTMSVIACHTRRSIAASLCKPAGCLRRSSFAIFDRSVRSADRNRRVSMAMAGGRSRISSRSGSDRQRLKIGRCLVIGKAIFCPGSKNSYIATLVERHTRYVMLAKVANKDTQTVISALIKQAKKLPRELYKSLTWDRGKELTDHRRFTLATDIDVYFCDPQSPWQRGSNENTNGLLRQYFPKGTDLSVHSQAHLNKVARQLNERPRETLQFETPAERFNACVASTG